MNFHPQPRKTAGKRESDQSFELVNGVSNTRTDTQLPDDRGVNYSAIRVQTTMSHDFDVKSFAPDNRLITPDLQDADFDSAQLSYKVDRGMALDPAVKVSGWKGLLKPTAVAPHVYGTTTACAVAGPKPAPAHLTFSVQLNRTSHGPLFEGFWISALAMLLGLLAF